MFQKTESDNNAAGDREVRRGSVLGPGWEEKTESVVTSLLLPLPSLPSPPSFTFLSLSSLEIS